ncbi:unnamed protein product [Arabis nemorensis]|uniref:Uncharacterized protein n=1 Tax=Arabis nemorensis TaxID=586526 RepID=A0A565CCG6_9BRAS|nr:unnamed protein product [Arabis nemorensis]
MGIGEATSSATSRRSQNSRSKAGSWARRTRNTVQNHKKVSRSEVEGADPSAKRKATGSSELSSKLSKNAAGLMVHQKPSSKDI